MSRILTSFTRLTGVRVPIVGAAMAGASGGSLAARVTEAGGLGFMAIGYKQDPDNVKNELSLARQILNVELRNKLPIGVGALGWQLDQPDSGVASLLRMALDENVTAIWLSFGDDLGKWIASVREHDREVGDGRKTLVFVQVSTVKEALQAVHDWRTDVLVVQGNESGGHGLTSAPSTSVLLTSILAVLPQNAPPVLGAGGITAGAQIASILTLGASGAVIGTRFLASHESLYSEAQKKTLLEADASSTIRSMAFDRARGQLGWPQGVDGRGIWNKSVEDEESGATDEEMAKRLAEGAKAGKKDRLLVWSGSGVGMIKDIKPVGDIVRELHDETMFCLKRASDLLQD